MQEIKIGKFKTRNNFLSFISGSKFSGTKIRLNRDEAYIDGNKLSGMLTIDGKKVFIHRYLMGLKDTKYIIEQKKKH